MIQTVKNTSGADKTKEIANGGEKQVRPCRRYNHYRALPKVGMHEAFISHQGEKVFDVLDDWKTLLINSYGGRWR